MDPERARELLAEERKRIEHALVRRAHEDGGEPGEEDSANLASDLYQDELDEGLADDLRATAAPYTGWAGFNYDTGLPRDRLKEVLLHCAANDIRANPRSPGRTASRTA